MRLTRTYQLPYQSMKNYLSNLRTTVWRTSSARYNAARRLKRRELFSTVSLAFFSAMSVAVAFLQRIYATPASNADNYFTMLSAGLGIFLLTISLIELGAGTGAKAEALHKNAEELNGLQNKLALELAKLDSGKALDWQHIETLSLEYEEKRINCRHNHAPIDDKCFLASKRKSSEFLNSEKKPAIGQANAIWINFLWQFASIWYFSFFWIIISIAIILPWFFPGWWGKAS